MAICRQRRCTRSAQTGRGGYCIAHSVLCLIQGCLLYAQYQCLGMCQGHYEQRVMSFVYDEDNDPEYNPEDANSEEESTTDDNSETEEEESTTDDDSETEEEDDNLNLQAELEQNSDDEDELSDDDEEQSDDEEQDLDVWGGRGGDENMFDDDDNGGGGDDDEGGNVGDPDNDEVVPPEVEGQQEEPPADFALEDAVQQPPDNNGNSNTKKGWTWKKLFGVVISVLLCFSVSCGAAIRNYATSDRTSSKRTAAHTDYTDIVIDNNTNSLISAAGEGSNVTSPPSDTTNCISSLIKMFPFVINRTLGHALDDDDEGEDTNGTSSSGFSYTVESVATEVSSHSQLFMDDYIYSLDTPSMMFMVDVTNPSFVEAEVVDFVCMDIRECVDIRQTLYLFTRDVSYPATTTKITTEKDAVYMKVLACITIVWALYVSLSSVEKDDGKGDDEAGDGGEQSALDADDEEVGDGGEQSALDVDNSPEAPIRDQINYFSSPGPSQFFEAMLRG